MDIEQLKLVLEMVGAVTDEAGTLVLLWLLLSHVVAPVTWLITLLVGGVTMYKCVAKWCLAGSSDTRELCEEIIGRPCDYIKDEEYTRTMRMAVRIVREHKAMLESLPTPRQP